MSGAGAPVQEVVDCADLRVAVVAASWHTQVMDGLLDGALRACADYSVAEPTVVRVPGAFELPVAAAAMAELRIYSCLVALGAVIRGDTPHFDFVAGEAARGLGQVAVRHCVPVGFGVLTVDSMSQAIERAGGRAGNKGHEAAAAALQTADLLAKLRAHHAQARD
jgi:6,7-dimethyl-8-ribityllumazine synthase